jgi:hypothetical protein
VGRRSVETRGSSGERESVVEKARVFSSFWEIISREPSVII